MSEHDGDRQSDGPGEPDRPQATGPSAPDQDTGTTPGGVTRGLTVPNPMVPRPPQPPVPGAPGGEQRPSWAQTPAAQPDWSRQPTAQQPPVPQQPGWSQAPGTSQQPGWAQPGSPQQGTGWGRQASGTTPPGQQAGAGQPGGSRFPTYGQAGNGQPQAYGQQPGQGQQPGAYGQGAGYGQQPGQSGYGQAGTAAGTGQAAASSAGASWGQSPQTQTWQQPGSTSSGQPAAAPWAAQPAPTRKSRRPLYLALAGLLVLALVAGGFFFLRSDPLSWQGRTIAQPEQVLSDAEETLTGYVEERNGATGDDSRCYFEFDRPDESDVTDALVCGPALFVDGNPDDQYLLFPLTASGGEGDATLTVADEPTSPDPQALPDRELLTRPDGSTPPDGAGGLEVPAPPRADSGFSTDGPLDGVDLAAPEGPATLVGAAAAVTVTGVGSPDRIGEGDEARRPAEGEQFLAFSYDVATGEGGGDGAPTISYQIADADPVPVDSSLVFPGATVEGLVSAPEGAESAVLSVEDNGVVQTLSLLDGAPGADNLAVLVRENREQVVNATQPISGQGTSPGRPIPTTETLNVSVVEVRLLWYVDDRVTAVPSAPDRAFLLLEDNATIGNDGAVAGRLPSDNWTLTLPDGTSIRGTDVSPDPTLVGTVFEVPADFTTGTLTFGGATTFPDGGVLDYTGATITFPVEIPAG